MKKIKMNWPQKETKQIVDHVMIYIEQNRPAKDGQFVAIKA